MATIATITPGYARAGDSGIAIVGTGFVAGPALTEVYFRLGGGAWTAVAPARVTYVSATELSIAIDEANTDGWEEGWQDIGVCDFEEGAPESHIDAALHFFGEDHMAEITKVYPSCAKAGEATITIVGTGFVDEPSLTKVYHRAAGETSWVAVDAARVTYVSATELSIAIDEANTDVWVNGLNDVGVCDAGESTPDGYLKQALFFFTAGTFNPDAVIKGAPDELYIRGLFMGHTHGGLTVAHGIDTSTIEVDQSLMPVRIIKAGETFDLSVPLAEVTLENLRAIWGVSAAIETLGASRRRLTFGGDSNVPEVPVMMIVPAGAGKKWAVTFYRCAVTGPGDLVWSRDDQVNLPLKVTVLADTSRAVGDQTGRIEEYALA
jgi:hypothetical protein